MNNIDIVDKTDVKQMFISWRVFCSKSKERALSYKLMNRGNVFFLDCGVTVKELRKIHLFCAFQLFFYHF